tara:strand:- start:2063 stop:2431 length:369 start_codon:yes stop_codon:yes gene_type:complete
MADSGFGTTITFSSGFFAEIISVDGPDLSREAIDTTHMGTTNGWKTFIPSDLKDGGTLSVEMAYDPGTSPPIADAESSCTVTYPDASTCSFTGFMTSFSSSIPIDDRMTASAEIKVNGAVSF